MGVVDAGLHLSTAQGEIDVTHGRGDTYDRGLAYSGAVSHSRGNAYNGGLAHFNAITPS